MRIVKQLIEGRREIYSIGPDQPVLAAIQMMADKFVGALLVVRGDDLLGIVSERDYARKVILKGRSSSDTPVRDIMTADLITVSPHETVHRCMRLVTDKHIRHLPVVENGKVIGMLSIGDLVKAVIDDQAEQLEQLQRYISG
ncbi:MAG: CBS domain-containing protein [Proteobacteria bacterium]|uniref:CBS domain-containing protein n=1 Tax=Rudaea sp. TaxID=2136325 RepID=UPI001E19E00B|nr:CBS domain-containing protein [Pseudomonadota bacterium]MBS0567635.1 CBS domain-containing protein [Pseudomonadota bacterium]